MNIHADGIDSLTLAIDDLRAAVDRWINDQKNRLRSLEEDAASVFDAAGCEEPGPIHPAMPVRLAPSARPVASPPSGGLSGTFPVQPPARRTTPEESGVQASRGSGDSISSRERLDALARHLNDRLRRNKDQSSDRITLPPTS